MIVDERTATTTITTTSTRRRAIRTRNCQDTERLAIIPGSLRSEYGIRVTTAVRSETGRRQSHTKADERNRADTSHQNPDKYTRRVQYTLSRIWQLYRCRFIRGIAVLA